MIYQFPTSVQHLTTNSVNTISVNIMKSNLSSFFKERTPQFKVFFYICVAMISINKFKVELQVTQLLGPRTSEPLTESYSFTKAYLFEPLHNLIGRYPSFGYDSSSKSINSINMPSI